jgi:hypothetical protein
MRFVQKFKALQFWRQKNVDRSKHFLTRRRQICDASPKECQHVW